MPEVLTANSSRHPARRNIIRCHAYPDWACRRAGFIRLLCRCTECSARIPSHQVCGNSSVPAAGEVSQSSRYGAAEVTTDGDSITNIIATSDQKLLSSAAEANVKTWTFLKHKPQTFTVTFVYKLEEPEVYGFVNPIVLLELSNRVEVRAKLPLPMP